jgi:hypothetical protein
VALRAAHSFPDLKEITMPGDTDAIWADAGRFVLRWIGRAILPLIILGGLAGLVAMLAR